MDTTDLREWFCAKHKLYGSVEEIFGESSEIGHDSRMIDGGVIATEVINGFIVVGVLEKIVIEQSSFDRLLESLRKYGFEILKEHSIIVTGEKHGRPVSVCQMIFDRSGDPTLKALS
jgi:hypothetical protein